MGEAAAVSRLNLNPAVGLDVGANSFAYLPAGRQAINRIILFIL
jgi:hypothetical protein